jgi:hypothetical protein
VLAQLERVGDRQSAVKGQECGAHSVHGVFRAARSPVFVASSVRTRSTAPRMRLDRPSAALRNPPSTSELHTPRSLRSRPAAALDSRLPAALGAGMSQHTPPSRQPRTSHRCLPRGRAKLLALTVAVELAATLAELSLPRGLSHLRDHLVRAAEQLAASSPAIASTSRSEDDSRSGLIGVSHKPRSGAVTPR